jgi:hypothetical protein
VGRFRQQLVNLVALMIAIDLAAGVVALAARSDRAPAVTAAQRANAVPASAGASRHATGAQSGSVLAGGSFTRRRRSSSTARPTAEAAAGTIGTSGTNGTIGTSGTSGATGTKGFPPPSAAGTASLRPGTGATGGSSSSRTKPAAPAAGQPTTTAPSGSPIGSVPDEDTAGTVKPATGADAPPRSDTAPAPASTTATSAPAKATTPSYSSGVWTVVDDPTGDTVVDSSDSPQANPRADIVQTRAANTTKGVGFAVKVAQPGDPTRDPNWASAATLVLWEVDTSGDGKPDFEVEYFVEGGKLVAGVNRLGANGSQAACEAEAGYMSDSYVVGIDPACLGSPASLSFRANIYYATDPNNEKAAVIADVAPDAEGMAGPVRRTAA